MLFTCLNRIGFGFIRQQDQGAKINEDLKMRTDSKGMFSQNGSKMPERIPSHGLRSCKNLVLSCTLTRLQDSENRVNLFCDTIIL